MAKVKLSRNRSSCQDLAPSKTIHTPHSSTDKKALRSQVGGRPLPFIRRSRMIKKASSKQADKSTVQQRLVRFWVSFSSIFGEQHEGFTKESLVKINQKCRKDISSMSDLLDKRIDCLFDVKVNWSGLRHYLKILTHGRVPTCQRILLANEKEACILKVNIESPQLGEEIECYEISLEDANLIQERNNFIENIVRKQEQYPDETKKLSDATKELLYLGASYRRMKASIEAHLSQIAQQTPTQGQLQFSTEREYIGYLIKKNLRKAFLPSKEDFDFLNYFKERNHCESEQSEAQFIPIQNFKELKKYLWVRGGKKKSRHSLKTSCSVCLSSYYQLYNPFLSCSKCHLRTHRNCWNLTKQACGNCTYNQISRKAQQSVSHCYICKRKGIMTVQLQSFTFAHPFCLIIHGLWVVTQKKNSNLLINSKTYEEGSKCTIFFPDFFVNESIKNQQIFTREIQLCKSKEDKPIDRFLASMSRTETDRFQQLSPPESILEPNAKTHESYFSSCEECFRPFYQEFSCRCIRCGRSYHTLCAYLKGFAIDIIERNQFSNEFNLRVDCCIASKNREAWIRRFKLNIDNFTHKLKKESDLGDLEAMNLDVSQYIN